MASQIDPRQLFAFKNWEPKEDPTFIKSGPDQRALEIAQKRYDELFKAMLMTNKVAPRPPSPPPKVRADSSNPLAYTALLEEISHVLCLYPRSQIRYLVMGPSLYYAIKQANRLYANPLTMDFEFNGFSIKHSMHVEFCGFELKGGKLVEHHPPVVR